MCVCMSVYVCVRECVRECVRGVCVNVCVCLSEFCECGCVQEREEDG